MASESQRLYTTHLGQHLAWKERIMCETTSSCRSLDRGLKLGVINEAPALKNAAIPPAELYHDNPLFQDLMQKSLIRFPARNLSGYPARPKGLVLGSLGSVSKRETPFGLYPVLSSKGLTSTSPIIFSPVRTSIRTYSGEKRLGIFCLQRR